MKAIAYPKTSSIEDPQSLIEIEVPAPTLDPHDLLVEVRGVSLNPVDVKVRTLMEPEDGPRILGWDAAGIVRETGSAVSNFRVGDEVFYAGDLNRPGTNAQLHAVDERLVGKKPAALDFAEAAGLPLTSLTAWELLFDSFALPEGGGQGETLLVIGGAGGVGSILIQLAKKLTKLKVIATASRPETTAWVKKMGADEVINHRHSLVDQLADLAETPRYVASLTGTQGHFPAIVDLIRPRGHIALIDDPENLNVNIMKPKALSFSWEFMFTRSSFQTEDMVQQHKILTRISEMLDAGTLLSTVTNNLGSISVSTLKEAHRRQESGTVIGKNVLTGFAPQE